MGTPNTPQDPDVRTHAQLMVAALRQQEIAHLAFAEAAACRPGMTFVKRAQLVQAYHRYAADSRASADAYARVCGPVTEAQMVEEAFANG